MSVSKIMRSFGLGVVLTGLALPTFAALPQEEGGESSTEGGAVAEPVEADSAETWYLAVVGGDIYTGTGEVLRGAKLLARNGKIVRIGHDVEIPGIDYDQDVPEADRKYHVEVLDVSNVRNARIYPGIVAIQSSGLLGTNSDFRDSIDPFNQNMVLGLASGITTTGISSSAVKLKRWTDGPRPYNWDGIVVRDTAYSNLTFGNAASRRSLREKLVAASEYLRKYRVWEEEVKKDKELKEPARRGVDNTVLRVLRGEVAAKFRANERAELLAIARLAREFDFRPVIEGAREGWVVADELGRAGAYVVLTPRERRDKDERLVREGGSSIENAALLHAAGVPVAIVPQSTGVDLGGIVGRDIMHLPMEVGFAIRGGLPEEAGIAGITTVPARMMGISHRVGTLEKGKDADLVVTDGDLLHYQTFVQYTVVDGAVVYDKEKELYFAHIRPRPAVELAPETKVDAGESPDEPEPTEEEAAEEEEPAPEEGEEGVGEDGEDDEDGEGEDGEGEDGEGEEEGEGDGA